MFFTGSPRGGLPIALVVLSLTSPSLAQTSPAPPEVAAVPPPPEAAWEAPPPLPPGARVPRPAPVYEPEPVGDVARRDFVTGQRECEDPQRAGRIVAESFAGSAAVAASVFVGMFAQDASSTGQVLFGTLGAGLMYLLVTPAAVGLVGRSFGGNGRYWASLLGGLLIPVVGHVGGYELSHEPICDDPPRAPRAQLRRRDRARPTATAVRVVPTVAPSLAGSGGGTAGVAITF